MKYLIIPFIALGFTLSLILRIEYTCIGSELFPVYYGSPFVFKMASLTSSMQYYYCVSGLFLNLAVWSLIIAFARYGILVFIENSNYNKGLKALYKALVTVLVVFTCITIFSSYIDVGQGFDKDLNYWYWNLDQKAKDWGLTCEGEWRFL